MARQTIAEAVREEARVEDRRETLTELLRQRFGELPAPVEGNINASTDAGQLLTWIGRVIPAASLTEIGIVDREGNRAD
jgi:hypothetical protein